MDVRYCQVGSKIWLGILQTSVSVFCPSLFDSALRQAGRQAREVGIDDV